MAMRDNTGRWMGLVLLSIFAATAAGARVLDDTTGTLGRQLLDITTSAFGTSANFTLEVVAPKGSPDSKASCVFKGYPGANQTAVQGPLIVQVPIGGVTNITFGPLKNSAIVALYNQTANNTLITTYNATYGLISATLIANGSTSVGASAYLTAGRVDDFPKTPQTQPTCLVNVTFVVVPQPPPPPPPSPPPPSPPPPSDYLSGLLPKNPCYCTPVVNGQASCFNFDAAGTDINCATPSGYSCAPAMADGNVFSVAPGPVFQCNTTATTAAGR